MSGHFGSSSRSVSLPDSHSGSLSALGRVTCESPHLIQWDHEPEQLTVKLMETPLRGPSGVLARRNVHNGHGLIGKHDYVLLEVAPAKWIKAEKVGESSYGRNDAGIKLSPVEYSSEDAGSTVRFEARFPLGRGQVKWTFAALHKILARPSPDYNVLGENCWAYAFECVHAILNWCLENAADENVRVEVLRHLETLKPVQRPAPKAVMSAFVHPSRPESAATKELLRQKLAHTREHLPATSQVRRMTVSAFERIVGKSDASK